MVILVVFAFLAGIVTILSPCILPILPVVLSGTVTTGRRRPFGIVFGFILSFTFFTLTTSTLVKALGIPADVLRWLSIIIVATFGVSLIFPQLQQVSEKLFTTFSRYVPATTHKDGFWGGLLTGLSIGLVWTPCVGPILAAVISLSFSSTVTYASFLITFAYALGTALPMVIIIYAGRSLFARVPLLLQNLSTIQKGFGVLMIFTALAIATNVDRTIQTYLLEKFPQWGTGLTQFEDNDLVQQELGKLTNDDGTPVRRKGDVAPELIVGGEWLNTEPLSLTQLKGKVVLVDFWTYTCINCIRTLPYLKKWHDAYQDNGLVIVGVHSPEFEFEKSVTNLRKAIADYGITYPVMQDNNFATWRAYDNRYWPAKYLIDSEGKIAYVHFGEGEYDQTEKVIQQLLREKDGSLAFSNVQNESYDIQSFTPETYLGWSRTDRLAVKERLQTDEVATYTPEYAIPPKNIYDWRGRVLISKEYARPQKGAVLRFTYDARNVFLVVRTKGQSSTFKVTLNGNEVPALMTGADLRNGRVTVTDDRLYSLIEGDERQEQILTIEFLDDDAEVFAFTFG